MEAEQASESTARRAAKRAGLLARKSRRQLSADNHGRFQLLDPIHNRIVAGVKFDLTNDEVVEYCAR